MRIGTNEKIVFSLLKQYPHLTNNKLQALFAIVTHRQARVDLILDSLDNKGLVDKKTRTINNSAILENEMIEEVKVPKKIIDGLDHFNDSIKLGKDAKSILYILLKTKKSSLQFLATFFNLPIRNIYAILRRLEQKGLVVSYNSRVRHVNTRGRHYNPKYFVLTDLGNLWTLIKLDGTVDTKHIDELLERPQKEIENITADFQYH